MFHGDLKGYTFEDSCSKVDSVYTILCEFEKIFFFSHKLKEKTGKKKDQTGEKKKDQMQGYFLC